MSSTTLNELIERIQNPSYLLLDCGPRLADWYPIGGVGFGWYSCWMEHLRLGQNGTLVQSIQKQQLLNSESTVHIVFGGYQ